MVVKSLWVSDGVEIQGRLFARIAVFRTQKSASVAECVYLASMVPLEDGSQTALAVSFREPLSAFLTIFIGSVSTQRVP